MLSIPYPTRLACATPVANWKRKVRKSLRNNASFAICPCKYKVCKRPVGFPLQPLASPPCSGCRDTQGFAGGDTQGYGVMTPGSWG